MCYKTSKHVELLVYAILILDTVVDTLAVLLVVVVLQYSLSTSTVKLHYSLSLRVDLVPGLYAPRPDTLESTSPPKLSVLVFASLVVVQVLLLHPDFEEHSSVP